MRSTTKNASFLAITSLILLFLSIHVKSQPLTIHVQNTTGRIIDSLIVGNYYIGTIKNDSSTGPIQFEKFQFDSGVPNESIFDAPAKNA